MLKMSNFLHNLLNSTKRDSNIGVFCEYCGISRPPILRNICERLLLIFMLLHFIHSISNNSGIVTRLHENFRKAKIQIIEAVHQRCSENMQQTYRRTPMSKCDFNKVPLQLNWNQTSAWVFSCKFTAYFPFTKNTSGWLLLRLTLT